MVHADNAHGRAVVLETCQRNQTLHGDESLARLESIVQSLFKYERDEQKN